MPVGHTSIDQPLGAAATTRALVIGDCMLDRDDQGEARRLSPEAPVPVVSVARRAASPGGAANVAAGLSALGVTTTLAGLVGNDDGGRELLDLVRLAGVEPRIAVGRACTVTKTRILAAGRHQLLRLDEDGDREVREAGSDALLAPNFEAVAALECRRPTILDCVLRPRDGKFHTDLRLREVLFASGNK